MLLPMAQRWERTWLRWHWIALQKSRCHLTEQSAPPAYERVGWLVLYNWRKVHWTLLSLKVVLTLAVFQGNRVLFLCCFFRQSGSCARCEG